MLAILKKEINSFFASPIGYLVVSIFLIVNGLFLWLFKGEFNILDYGFADVSSFFLLAPWVLLFLIPAVTMRSFSDEKKQGTIELLLTKPISHFNIVFAKYLAAFILIIIALIPTLLYVFTVYQLGNPVGNLDMGSTLGSYFGLLFLVATYTVIGVFASTVSDNQIVAFIIAVFICLFFFIGMDSIAEFTSSTFVEQLGINSHFKSMSRGVLDSRDILYFLSVTLFFLILTKHGINTKKAGKKELMQMLVLGLGLLVLNIFTQSTYKRFDLTKDQRYTLNQSTLDIIKDVDSPIIIDVFLEGDFPSEFRRLQTETKQLLEEFSAYNPHIIFNFINPLEDDNSRDANIRSLNQRGLTPLQLSVNENGKSTQEVIFPWALASYNNETVKISLLKNKIGASAKDMVSNSVQQLEYVFADGFSKLVYPKRRKIAVLRGNGQLENKYIADFVKTLRDYYFIAPFTLDSVASNAQQTLDKLEAFDLIINAKPTQGFSEQEKLVLDQFIMNGGKSLWLIDKVAIDKDSLYNDAGKSFATARNLNLTDFFFKYGVRINPVLVNDLYSAPITLAIGEGSEAQFQPIQWQYSPLASGANNHPIVNNINLVKFDFANQIDTLKNRVSKTILLQSSPLSKLLGAPREISLDIVTKQPDRTTFISGNQTLAILLEGKFTSVYNNRVKPFNLLDEKNKSIATKMVVIADGDVIKNDVGRKGPQELGFDKWTGQTYGNKEFLLNAVNYLLDDDGLINIRSKEIAIAFLDSEKIASQKTKWQLINIVLPLVLLGVFGFIFNFYRKKKYAV
jgi:gliding-associated putative ABC transporter substrate-binding component GldG/gliding motility-associated ABC transporter permease protein GldF